MQDRICIFRFFVLFLHPLLKSCRDGGIGRHEGLKILWPETAVWVQVPLAVQSKVPKDDAEWSASSFFYAQVCDKFRFFSYLCTDKDQSHKPS